MPVALNNYPLQKTIDLKIGKIYFYENFLVTEINEGVTVSLKEAKQISKVALDYYGKKPIAYISNRKNSYSIIPVNYLKIKEVFPTIKAFGAVTYSEIQNDVINVENTFLQGMLQSFNDLDKAIAWAQEKLVS